MDAERAGPRYTSYRCRETILGAGWAGWRCLHEKVEYDFCASRNLQYNFEPKIIAQFAGPSCFSYKNGFGMFYVSFVKHFPRHIDENKDDPEFSVDCTDPMGRSALITAVDNENMDMLQMLLENGVQVKVSHPLNYKKKNRN